MNVAAIARGLLIFIAGFGSLAGGRLSLDHLAHGEICPVLGPIPACNIVLLGYLCVLIAAVLLPRAWANRIFYIGWTPVFGLALVGVILEVTQGQICPPGPIGIPQCFISFAMAGACWGLFRYSQRKPIE